MTSHRTLVGLVLIVGSSVARAGGGGEGERPDPCQNDRPPETRSVLHCRDGDPRCDMDGMCDGTCFVKSCIIPPKNPASCLLTSRFCPRGGTSDPLHLSKDEGPWLIPVGEARAFRYHATVLGAVCKRARRRCVPPTPTPCDVTITGDVNAAFACDVHLIALTPDRLMPSSFEILLRERDGPTVVHIRVNGAPAGGTFTAGVSERAVWGLDVRTAGANLEVFSGASSSTLDATLTLPYVDRSRTLYHDAHGTFDANAESFVYVGARVRFAVHTVF
jgi:hypothetical protein